MKRFLLFAAAALSALTLQAQKPALDHSVYDNWKSIETPSAPGDGEWVIYGVVPQEGDGILKFYNTRTGAEYAIERGSDAEISADGKRAVLIIKPKFQETRQARIDKKKPEQMPKDSLAVIDLTSGAVTARYPMLKSLKTPDEIVGHVAFTTDAKDTLYVLDIRSLAIDTLRCVENCYFRPDGRGMAYTARPGKKEKEIERGIYLYDFDSRQTVKVLSGAPKSVFGNAFFNEDGTRLAFYANLDTTKGNAKTADIWLYEGDRARKLVSRDAPGLRKGWKISYRPTISFHEGDSYITFGTCPIPREKDTTLVDFEQPTLDIWMWKDDYIQTVQKHRVNTTRNRTYAAKADLDGDGGIIQLADPEIPSVTVGHPFNQGKTIAATDKPYRVEQMWAQVRRYDMYAISLKDGSRTLLKKDVPYTSFTPSPDGAYLLYYDMMRRNWYLYDQATGGERDLTSELGVPFYDSEDDHPRINKLYGSANWFDDYRHFVINDEYDVWKFDAEGKEAPVRLTDGRGNRVRYALANPYSSSRKSKLAGTALQCDRPMYFTTFDRTTKKHGYAMLDITKKKAKLQRLVEGPYTYDGLCIDNSGKKPVYTYTKGNYEEGNNLWTSADGFKSEKQLTDINPQQRDYNWGTVELVNWITDDGIRAEGLLFKPENFDPAKKYPVMIYFYEKRSDELYKVRVPAPSASTVNIPYYVSNGYICFIPDIYYTDGHPGKSALKSILPACDMLCENPWIDGDNMAIQGQSWGGYQVAYMITQTNRFKAAGAGAPVSNMTSAYGGIRWESGIARIGQYEHGQSRIGKTLWDGLDLYVENSPLFFVPNVNTPVLIMSNDADGAVPWWQGIEFFNGLRRCGKQAWMLQYNDEAHNLKERRNKKDLSIRLAQFFDHFLKGAPAPVWMTKGVPAELKGIEYGYGYEVDENNDQQ